MKRLLFVCMLLFTMGFLMTAVFAVKNSPQTKAVFLDRDGTIIKDANYLSRIEQIELIPEMLLVCKALQEAGYKLFIVTNQSGVARGMFDEATVQEVNAQLQKMLLNEGIVIEKFFYCPHHPTAGNNPLYTKECICRKPHPGMLLQGAQEFSVDLSQSIMIGDKEDDVQAGRAAGCKSFLVQSIVKDPQGWLQEINSTNVSLKS